MNGSKKIYLGIGLIGLVLIFIYWLMPKDTANASSQLNNMNASEIIQTSSGQQNQLSGNAMQFSSPSQQDTQINCQLRIDGANRLIVNEQTKDCFEYFITQYGEKTIPQIDHDIRAYFQQNYQDPARSQIIDLWSRYLKYREKLGELIPPEQSKSDVEYYKSIIEQIQKLRQQFFSDFEIQALFGSEDLYNQYTIDRMRILNNKNLSEIEKAKRLKMLLNQLPEDLRNSIEQSNKLDELRQLTQAIKDRNGTEQEIRDMRLNLVGAEATQRLENLDESRQQWRTRVNQYLNQRDNILKSSMSDQAKQQNIQQLQQQQFQNAQERIRLNTYETIHDQGGNQLNN